MELHDHGNGHEDDEDEKHDHSGRRHHHHHYHNEDDEESIHDTSPLLPVHTDNISLNGPSSRRPHTKQGRQHAHGHKHAKEGFCDIKTISFIFIGSLTLIYVIGELTVAVWWGSLTLLSDGFHNLSDVVSLYIAFWAVQAAKRESNDKMSYGWVRSEILGGLTNGCFLLSLCLYVALESIPRFIDPPEFESGWPFIAVAAAGLAINTLGTLVFALTGLSHGHSHGAGHGHSHGHGKEKEKREHDEHGHSHGKGKKKKRMFDLNMWGVLVHYAGDMLSSAVVLAMGFIIHYVDAKWTLYIDPISSLIIVALILWTTVPLVKDCSMILLQSTPSEININSLREELKNLTEIESVHDLHVWQLTEGTVVCSVHVAVEEGTVWKDTVKKIKKTMHHHGIHSSTIQPEFVPRNHPVQAFCEENCAPGCEEDWCCKKTADRHKLTNDHAGHHHHHSEEDEENPYTRFREPSSREHTSDERLNTLP